MLRRSIRYLQNDTEGFPIILKETFHETCKSDRERERERNVSKCLNVSVSIANISSAKMNGAQLRNKFLPAIAESVHVM